MKVTLSEKQNWYYWERFQKYVNRYGEQVETLKLLYQCQDSIIVEIIKRLVKGIWIAKK